MITSELDWLFLISVMVDLSFIDADDIWPGFFKVVLKILLVENGTNAIDVPGADQQFAWSLTITILPLIGMIFRLISGGLVELLGPALWVFVGLLRFFG